MKNEQHTTKTEKRMMNDALPRTREQLQHRGTSYEVAARHPNGESVVVGFTPRTSRVGLLAVVRSRGDELIQLINVTDDTPNKFYRDGADRWQLQIGEWTVGFTGYTERDVLSMGTIR